MRKRTSSPRNATPAHAQSVGHRQFPEKEINKNNSFKTIIY